MNIERILKAIATGELKISYSVENFKMKTENKKIVFTSSNVVWEIEFPRVHGK